jgi:hypothetical protein
VPLIIVKLTIVVDLLWNSSYVDHHSAEWVGEVRYDNAYELILLGSQLFL